MTRHDKTWEPGLSGSQLSHRSLRSKIAFFGVFVFFSGQREGDIQNWSSLVPSAIEYGGVCPTSGVVGLAEFHVVSGRGLPGLVEILNTCPGTMSGIWRVSLLVWKISMFYPFLTV